MGVNERPVQDLGETCSRDHKRHAPECPATEAGAGEYQFGRTVAEQHCAGQIGGASQEGIGKKRDDGSEGAKKIQGVSLRRMGEVFLEGKPGRDVERGVGN